MYKLLKTKAISLKTPKNSKTSSNPSKVTDKTGEYHNFEVIDTNDRIVFGGATNSGFIESGYLIKDNDFSLDENLQELVADLEVYYNDGPEYVSRIVTNDRM